jgi:hypothetical protein
VVPPQDAAPWKAELTRLTNDEAYRQERAQTVRTAAQKFVDAIDPDAFGRYLHDLDAGSTAAAGAVPAEVHG